ncbi:MAG: 3-dehydroquinate synthase [Oscillospiraceae bacterium]|nr:3-dehydroquinate synthase [Oscillospiraceae bacterium]
MNYQAVTIATSVPYKVIIGDNLLEECGEIISREIKPCRAALISDENVMSLYGEKVSSSLENAGFKVSSFSFPAGEKSKTPDTLFEILDFLASNEFDRSDVVIALGGGVTGDIAGFASAIYMRGMKLVQIPTSLLAMVDSSVGGKTGVDLDKGKNLVGAFKQPQLVICDTEVLETLPNEQFACGMAEIIKYAMICDEKLFELLYETKERTAFSEDTLKGVISRCVEIKGGIVTRDEFDNGERQLLNFGHTIGHAIEKLSGYKIGHGQAVGIGMVMMTAISERLDICQSGTKSRLVELLESYELPTQTDFSVKALADAVVLDKKRRGDNITIIMTEKIGSCFYKSVPISEIEVLLNELGEEQP